MTDLYFKVLNENLTPHHGGMGAWVPGEWRSVKGEIVPCENGLHFVRLNQLVEWLGPAIWAFEIGNRRTRIIDGGDKLVCRIGRITTRYESWNEQNARLFAADCAEHVLHLFEQRYPDDDRPRKAIVAARAYARGEITTAARDAAGDAAWAAAWNTAGDAARAAARATARDAARDAARAAAWNAARATARDAARDAARAAAGAAERNWQTERLAFYLGIAP